MRLLFSLCLVAALFSSCTADKKTVSLDESNLERVLSVFYHPGSRISDAAATYRLLSARSREQVPQKQWEDAVAAQTGIIMSATVVRTEVVKGVTYGIVSLSEDVNGAASISTATWVLEEGKWRRIKLPLSMDKVNKAFNLNAIDAARIAANKWLAQDPFSTQAIETLIYCTERSEDKDPAVRDREIASLIRRLVSINPNDTRALFLAVSHAKDAASVKPYLKRLEGTAAYQPAVDALAGKADLTARDNESTVPDDVVLLMQKLIILADLNDIKEFTRLGSDSKTNDRLIEYLADQNPDEAAEYAGRLGLAYHKAGIHTYAEQWLAFGEDRDPDNKQVLKLGSLLANNSRR